MLPRRGQLRYLRPPSGIEMLSIQQTFLLRNYFRFLPFRMAHYEARHGNCLRTKTSMRSEAVASAIQM